jgi:hypothetical protein
MALVLTADANPGVASWTSSSAVIATAGKAKVLNGATTVVVAVGAQYSGMEALVSFAQAPTAAKACYATAVVGGNLTIGIDVDNTADIFINYAVIGTI